MMKWHLRLLGGLSLGLLSACAAIEGSRLGEEQPFCTHHGGTDGPVFCIGTEGTLVNPDGSALCPGSHPLCQDPSAGGGGDNLPPIEVPTYGIPPRFPNQCTCVTDTEGCAVPHSDPNADADGDGIPDCREDYNCNGVWDEARGESDWQHADTDRDGLPDGLEDANQNGCRDQIGRAHV